jgi:hypothetical protein
LRQAQTETTGRESRQRPTQSAPIRLLSADQNADQTNADSTDLSEIVAAWSTLPEPLRAGILAMVRSASGKDGVR